MTMMLAPFPSPANGRGELLPPTLRISRSTGLGKNSSGRRHRLPRDPSDVATGDSAHCVAHEMRQPLFAVLLNAEAALRWLDVDPLNFDEAERSIEDVIGNGRRALDVVRQVRGMLANPSEPAGDTDMNGIVADSLALTRGMLAEHGIAVEAELDRNMAPVRGNRIQLEGVAVNLITNAAEAMRTVDERRRRLRLSTRLTRRGSVLVEVGDRGTGIKPRDASRIFDPYFTTKAGGTGLGLSICRTIVEAHRGRLWAVPNRPHGSVFSFSIPAIDAA